MNRRLFYIDQLKGFAILLVVAGHVLEFCLYPGKTSFLHDMIYSFHMPLFAFLSGLVFTSLSDYKLVGKKLMKQSYRLLVPFLTMGMIYAYTIRKGEGFLLQPYKLGLWYLLFLWQCYIITNIYNVFLLPQVKEKRILNITTDVLWLIIIWGILKVIMKLCQPDVCNFIGSVHLIQLYPFFFIGCILKRVNFTPPIWRKCSWGASLCSLIWLFMVWIINLTPNSYPLKLVLCLGMLAISKCPNSGSQ